MASAGNLADLTLQNNHKGEPMIVVMEQGTTQAQIDHVVNNIRELGLHESRHHRNRAYRDGGVRR